MDLHAQLAQFVVEGLDVGHLKPEARAAWGLRWRTLVEFEEPTSEEVDDTAMGYLAPFAVPGEPEVSCVSGLLLPFLATHDRRERPVMDRSREPASPAELIAVLGHHPQVVGVVEYGSRRRGEGDAASDLDLVVVLDVVVLDDVDPGTGTIHGWVGAIPVDLGIVTASQLESARELVGWERVLLQGRVVEDTDGRVEHLLQRFRHRDLSRSAPEPAAFAGMRHGARHALLKAEAAEGRADPLLARLLLSSAASWLVQHWFTVRERDFPGERRALQTLREEAPEVIDALADSLSGQDTRAALTACERLAQLALQPVGGPWTTGEIIARDAQIGAPDAEQVWNSLLSGYELPTPERPKRPPP